MLRFRSLASGLMLMLCAMAMVEGCGRRAAPVAPTAPSEALPPAAATDPPDTTGNAEASADTTGARQPGSLDIAAVADSTPAFAANRALAGQDSDELIDRGTYFEWRVPSRPARLFSLALSRAGYIPGDAVSVDIRIDCNGFEGHYDKVVRIQTPKGNVMLGPGPMAYAFKMVSDMDTINLGFDVAEPVCRFHATHGNYMAYLKIQKRKPNLVISGLVRTNPGGLSFDYRMAGRVTGAQTVRAYWKLSDGNVQEFASWSIEASVKTGRYDIAAVDLNGKFVPRAAAILVVADPDFRTDESSEQDNRAELTLPDYTLRDLRWDNKGGVTFNVVVSGGRTPYNINPKVQVRWIARAGSLPAHDEVFESSSRPLFEASIPKSAGKYPFHATLRQLRRYELDSRTDLVAVIDFDNSAHYGLSLESDESEASNYAFLGLSANPISYELDKDAPYATTKQRRIELWVIENRSVIIKEAAKRHIARDAIAGAIIWEALKNPKRSFQSRGWGAGKTHWDTAVYVENLGYMPRLTDANRVKTMESPAGAIAYVAGIMNAYATEGEKVTPPYKFRAKPGILAAYFNGVKSLPEVVEGHYFVNLRNAGQEPQLPNSGMARWVHDNAAYITQVLTEVI